MTVIKYGKYGGRYGFIKCDYPLPIKGTTGLTYQSYQTAGRLYQRYELREDGTLWKKWFYFGEYHYEQEFFAGEMEFFKGDNDGNLLMYSANFVNGVLQTVEVVQGTYGLDVWLANGLINEGK